jgi:hypothetical protein
VGAAALAAVKPPRVRGHFPIKFTAGVMRVVAVLFVLGALLGGGAGVMQLQTISEMTALPVVTLGFIWIVGVVFALIYALLLWGFADALVLLADIDDSQRLAQREITELITERRMREASEKP